MLLFIQTNEPLPSLLNNGMWNVNKTNNMLLLYHYAVTSCRNLFNVNYKLVLHSPYSKNLILVSGKNQNDTKTFHGAVKFYRGY